MTSKHHNLKSFPERFAALLSGELKGECRFNGDRDFKKGDTVTLVESESIDGKYHDTGTTKNAVISFVDHYVPESGFVVLSYESVGVFIGDGFHSTNLNSSANSSISYSNDMQIALNKEVEDEV